MLVLRSTRCRKTRRTAGRAEFALRRLLLAGDKAGNWKRWYDRNIPIADDRYDEWLRTEL